MTKLKSSPSSWVKSSATAPQGFFETEAAGLNWLAETHTVPVVRVIDVADTSLTLERLSSCPPDTHSATTFGEQLGQLHSVQTQQYGECPPGVKDYFFGPLESPLQLPHLTSDAFGEFYVAARLRPLIALCEQDGALTASDAALLNRICDSLRAGTADGPAAVRTHGDLWSGNVMWTQQGTTLIDPAACGQHPMADIAMLMMFGCPHLEEILAGYQRHRPLPNNWKDSIRLHQLFGYLVHLHLFGRAYSEATLAAARSAAAYLGV